MLPTSNVTATRHTGTAIVVTPDATLGALVESSLRGMDVACARAETLREAAQLVQRHWRPCAVLIDLSTAEAITFVQRFKAHEKFAPIPVLALTEDPSLPEVKQAITAGANRWITKSFIATTLMTVMRQVVGH